MKIAITASGPTLDSSLDPRFGRCAYFLIVDTNSMELEAIENSNAALGGGAGIQSGQLIAAKGARFVLTGNCGPNAHETLSAAGIGVITGCSGAVREVIEQFKAGQLDAAGAPNVASHSGMTGPQPPSASQPGVGSNPRTGRGPGGGGGRGMGRGMGKGMGRGRGQGGGGMGQGRGRGRGMGA